ncbi:MAG: hypothetical protein GX335_09535 [Firmicutes bacterium]|nr:hypothetical protein [Bacillota bacterium]
MDNGKYHVEETVKDKFGDENDDEEGIIDTTAPDITITGIPVTNGLKPTITGTSNEIGSTVFWDLGAGGNWEHPAKDGLSSSMLRGRRLGIRQARRPRPQPIWKLSLAATLILKSKTPRR